MTRVLVLTPQLPYPPQQGTSLRNYHLLRALARHHSVTLLSFAEPDRPRELEPLQAIGRVLPPVDVPPRSGADRLAQLLTSGDPDLALRLRSDEYTAALTNALQADVYDAVQIEGIELAGKTGTSQVKRISKADRATGAHKRKDRPWKEREHALFVCFAPYAAPRYALSVIVEHGEGGGAVAGPIARDIMRRCLEIAPSTDELRASLPAASRG